MNERLRILLTAVVSVCIGASAQAGSPPSPVVKGTQIPETPYAVDQHDMEAIYAAARTPYKYGPVVTPADTAQMTDCPTVFRMDGRWYMTYVVYDGRGYVTRVGTSEDLLHWHALGDLLPHRSEKQWDGAQAAGYIGLQDMAWGGSYGLATHRGKYWMPYFGGPTRGYEARPLSLGMAWVGAHRLRRALRRGRAVAFARRSRAMMTSIEPEAQPWESGQQYKSSLYRTPDELRPAIGHRFMLYYNAYGVDTTDGRGAERIGLALSDDLHHWTRYAHNPVVAHVSKYDKWGITGDPQIQRMVVARHDGGRRVVVGGEQAGGATASGPGHGRQANQAAPQGAEMDTLYVMFYFRAIDGSHPKYKAYNTFACSRDLLHWTDWQGDLLIGPSEPYDMQFAHKSFVVRWQGVTYHYYCAVSPEGRRCIALATSADMTGR